MQTITSTPQIVSRRQQKLSSHLGRLSKIGGTDKELLG